MAQMVSGLESLQFHVVLYLLVLSSLCTFRAHSVPRALDAYREKRDSLCMRN